MILKFIYSEKATIFGEISTVDLSYVVTVNSMVEILQNLVAFSKYMNLNTGRFFPIHTKMRDVKWKFSTFCGLFGTTNKKGLFIYSKLMEIFK